MDDPMDDNHALYGAPRPPASHGTMQKSSNGRGKSGLKKERRASMPRPEPTSTTSKKQTRPEPSFEEYYASMTPEERAEYEAEPPLEEDQARIDALERIRPRTAKNIAELIRLGRVVTVEDMERLAGTFGAVLEFPDLQMEKEIEQAHANAEKLRRAVHTFEQKAKAFDEREVEQHESHRHMIEKVVEGTAKYRDIWTIKLIECIQGKGKRSFRVDETWTQLEAATALHSAARWPDGTDGTDEKWDEKDPYWRHRPPTVRMIKRRISHLELNTGKALYRHKPGSKHTRCDFCPPRS